jgi:predicted nucleic acid-binding protein
MKVFLDSDVLLDFFLDRAPFSEHSAAILDLCERRELSGITSPLVLSNVYSILRQKTTADKVMKCIHFLIDQLQITTMNRETVMAAIDSGFTDFEDSLQYGAVVSDKTIHCIVTRNIKDYKKSTVAVHTPAGLLALL